MDDQIEDMNHGIGEYYFKKARMYDTLCRDKNELLYKGCTNFTQLSAVLKLFNLKPKSVWMDKMVIELLE